MDPFRGQPNFGEPAHSGCETDFITLVDIDGSGRASNNPILITIEAICAVGTIPAATIRVGTIRAVTLRAVTIRGRARSRGPEK